MNTDYNCIDNTDSLRQYLWTRRGPDGFFESRLSDSAISTAIACIALEIADAQAYSVEIHTARDWLITHQNTDGLYGDSPESPANLTATFLAYIALFRPGCYQKELEKAKSWLTARFGDFSFQAVRQGLLAEYGRDLTFSVPILALAVAADFFVEADEAWRKMPQFPFELVLFPEVFFKYLNLPVVSYAIPALIVVGLAQLNHARSGIVKTLRSLAKIGSLKVLMKKQPSEGGFLEAAPLTAFCVLCLCAAGLRNHPVTQQAIQFLLNTQRTNGSWPIDRDLRQWTTSLSLTALASTLSEEEKLFYRKALKERQTKTIHPFTRSAPGGWAWTTYSGGVPDADDVPAALIALHELGEGASETIQNGFKWLLQLQNRDGGIPTFCRGWGKLPFDKSCPDLSAHVFKAFSCYENELPPKLRAKVVKAKQRILRYLKNVQRIDGAFIPLWFGDQESATKEAPVYGSAVVLEHLKELDEPFLQKTKNFLLSAQHATGGWGSWSPDSGGDPSSSFNSTVSNVKQKNDENNLRDYIIVTARCISALDSCHEAQSAVERGRAFLKPYLEKPETIPPEPIGLYFAHLWYSEELYGPIFLLKAFADVHKD